MGRSRNIKEARFFPFGAKIKKIRDELELTADTLCKDICEEYIDDGWQTSVQSKFESCDPSLGDSAEAKLYPIHDVEVWILFKYLTKRRESILKKCPNRIISKIKREDIALDRKSLELGHQVKSIGLPDTKNLDYQKAFKCALEFIAENSKIEFNREILSALLKERIEEVVIKSRNVSFTIPANTDRDNLRSAGWKLEHLSRGKIKLPPLLDLGSLFRIAYGTGLLPSQLISRDNEYYEIFRTIELISETSYSD